MQRKTVWLTLHLKVHDDRAQLTAIASLMVLSEGRLLVLRKEPVVSLSGTLDGIGSVTTPLLPVTGISTYHRGRSMFGL